MHLEAPGPLQPLYHPADLLGLDLPRSPTRLALQMCVARLGEHVELLAAIGAMAVVDIAELFEHVERPVHRGWGGRRVAFAATLDDLDAGDVPGRGRQDVQDQSPLRRPAQPARPELIADGGPLGLRPGAHFVDDSVGERNPRPSARVTQNMRTPIQPAACLAAIGLSLALAACGQTPGDPRHPTTAAEAAHLVLAQQPRFAGTGPLDPDLIGQAAWYEVDESADGWQVVIRIGWGDCPAGCINEHRWTYMVKNDGTVTLTHEEGDTLADATGVRGTVSAGPNCPVVRDPPDPACADRPVGGAILVIADQAGAEVARLASKVDGTFAVDLAPGTYRLTALPVEGLMGTPAPIDFAVDVGQPAVELQVSYDTGIR